MVVTGRGRKRRWDKGGETRERNKKGVTQRRQIIKKLDQREE